MKTFKIVPRLFAVFGLVMMFAVSGWSTCASLASTELNVTSSYTSTSSFKRLLLNDADGNCMDYANIRGRMMMIGNQALCAMDNTKSTTQCIDPNSKAEVPSNINSGGCANDYSSNDGCQNNDFSGGPDSAYLGLADYDDNATFGISSTAAAQTTSSTMAPLTLKTGDTVIFARLYWMGRMADNTAAAQSNVGTAKLLTPTTSGGYEDVSCTRYDRIGSNYSCSADVTAKVTQSGEYWVGNIKGRENSSNNFAAWSLVVVVQNDKDPFRNISIYEGFDEFHNETITIPVSGFLTPIDTATDLDASFYIFAGESDNGYGDYARISHKINGYDYVTSPLSPNLSDGTKDLLNATITQDGDYAVGSLPNYTNAMGIDIDTFDISSLLDHNQTSTNIEFTSTQDQLYVPMIAISTNIYEPKFCYDYAYSQNNRFFTEDHNGSTAIVPHVVSEDIISGDPIVTKIQLRNMEKGAVASNVMLRVNIADVETDAEFSSDKAELNATRTTAGGLTYTAVPASDFTSHTSSLVRYKLADSMPYDAATFTQFKINPLNSSLDFPLDMSIDFQITLSGIPALQYTGFKLKDDIPICSANNFAYTVPWGIYSPVDRDLFAGTGKYNIGTQVAKRPFSVDVVSFNPTNLNTQQSVRDYIAVEMIDVGGFHDINTTCRDPQALTSRVWIPFGNFQSNGNKATTDGNISKIPLNLDLALSRGLITSAEKDSFFNVARENTALRVWTLVNGTGQKLDIGFNATGTGGSNPKPDFSANSAWLTSTGCSTVCSSASMINGSTIKTCLECLYLKGAYPLCSRDNFAIRPESYNVRLGDVNQTNLTGPATIFASDRTGNITTPNSQRVGVSADYNYRFDINATDHFSNSAVPGYTRYFRSTSGNTDYNATFIWEPTVANSSGCNDTSSYPQNIKIKDGLLHSSSNSRTFPEVGDYRFNITDRTWTAVDWDDTKMVHHTSNASYFVAGDDCTANSNIVYREDQPYYNSNSYYRNGCDISSTHTNQSLIASSQLKYSDYNLTVRPYKFNLALTHGLGLNNLAIGSGGTGFVYDSNITNISDMNMSVRSTGTVSAVGYSGVELSNFVQDCYASDLNITLGHNASLVQLQPFTARMINSDANTSAQIFDSGKVTMGVGAFATIDDTHFSKLGKGNVNTTLRYNFDRNQTTPLNPQVVHYGNLDIGCAVVGQCTRQADGISGDANGTSLMNFDITHAYGRIVPRGDTNVFGFDTFTATAYYEVFNAPAMAGVAPSIVAPGTWFVNTLHDDTSDGNAAIGFIDPASGSNMALGGTTGYANGVETYNFTTPFTIRQGYKAHIDTDAWLWYLPSPSVPLAYLDPNGPAQAGADNLNCLTHPCFNIIFRRSIGNTGSAKTESEAHKNNKNSTTGGGWSTTREYAPSSR